MRSLIDKCIVLIAIFVFTRSLSLSLSLVLTHKVCFLWCGLLPNSKEWRSRLIVYPITGLVSPFFFYLYHSRQFQFPHIFASNGKNKTQTNRKNISSVHCALSIHLMQHCLSHRTRILLFFFILFLSFTVCLLSPNCLFAYI